MTSLPHLILDLGAILTTAAAVSILFRHMRWPVVVGYLVAGFILGPHFAFFHTVKDVKNISVWAEIGIIFMLFGLGLEFSFRRLGRVGFAALVTALVEVPFMIGSGYLAGRSLNWAHMDSLFLGGILAISSTAIIVRTFSDYGIKGQAFVQQVFGVLVIEDLVAILLLVLLSSVAVTQSLSGSELLFSGLRLGFFLVLWFLLGLFVLPVLMRRFKKYLSNETLLIVSLGLCLGMVLIATRVGFSPALGAFVMGSLLAETHERQRIEHLVAPIKDLFSAIFFVSVGMLIDPNVLKEYPGTIALLTLVVLLGKFLSASFGSLMAGRPVKDAVRVGLSLTQIGEFSFIIATLGLSLKVTSAFLYPVAVAVSVLTTSFTPLLVRRADQVAAQVESRIPLLFLNSLYTYQRSLASVFSQMHVSSVLWKDYGFPIFLNGVVVIAINLFVSQILLPFAVFGLQDWSIPSVTLDLFFCALTLLVSAPFLWAIFVGKRDLHHSYSPDLRSGFEKLQVAIVVGRFVVGCIVTGFVVSHYTSPLAWSGGLLISITAAAFLFFAKLSAPLYDQIERHFISHLNGGKKNFIKNQHAVQELAPWNASIGEFEVAPHSSIVAHTLREAALKERFGVTVALIDRGARRIMAPKHTDLLLPYDKIYVIGTDEQLLQVQDLVETKDPVVPDLAPVSEQFRLVPLLLQPGDVFLGKSIRESGIREALNGLVVGLERHGKRLLNPDSAVVLLAGDLVWVVGERDLVREFKTHQVP